MLAAVSVTDIRGATITTALAVESPRECIGIENPRPSVDDDVRLRQMVDANFDFIWRTLRGLGVSSALADDATQQVFWIAARKIEAIAIGSERPFLFATARGVAANLRRAEGRRREQIDERAVARQIDESPDPEEAAATNQARKLLEELLHRMEEDLRTAFVLFELEGLTMSAIAELLCIPMGTVASRLRRARVEFDRETARLQDESEGMR